MDGTHVEAPLLADNGYLLDADLRVSSFALQAGVVPNHLGDIDPQVKLKAICQWDCSTVGSIGTVLQSDTNKDILSTLPV